MVLHSFCRRAGGAAQEAATCDAGVSLPGQSPADAGEARAQH